MTLLTIVALGAVGLGVGCLIGSVGIGGVLLVPTLTYLFGVPIYSAIPAVMAVFIASGAVGAAVYARHGSIRWRPAAYIVAGAAPGALVGAMAATETPAKWLEILIAALIVMAGLDARRRSKRPAEAKAPRLGPLALFGLGGITGLGSAMTGTGGPLMLVPLTLWLGFPALTAIGFGQAASLPIALAATGGNLLFGTIDWTLAGVLALTLTAGTGIGAKLAHVVQADLLRRLLAWVLIAVGIFILLRLALAL